MATSTRQRSSAASTRRNGSTPARKTTRVYVVVKENGSTLTVVDPAREAKDQKAATDAVLAEMKPEDRNVKLGAFLAASYKVQKYGARQEWVTDSSEVPPGFVAKVAAEAAPAS
jgi:hypothetical protein